MKEKCWDGSEKRYTRSLDFDIAEEVQLILK
jgi:hypothetical protein